MKTVKKSLLRLALVLAVLAALCCTAFAIENFHVNSKQELVDVLSEQLEDRVTNFSVTYDGDYLDLVDRYLNPDLSLLLRQLDATEPNPDSSGPDYNTLNLKSAAAGVLDHVLYFSFEYFTSQKQEAELDAKCEAIYKSLQLDGLSDYAKVREIYEYIGTNFVYDDSLSIFSPYYGLKTGTMVCQGYSLLLTKLLWLAGVPNRILIGDGGGEPHSWNIVKLNGSWYDLDVTWDAAQRIGQAMTWNFFLRGSANFPAHTAADAYQAYSFASQYPVSSSDYDAPRITLSIKGSAVQSLILRLNTPVQLVSSVSGCTFVSTDPSIVSVDQNGNLTARRTGDCSIIARTADRSVVPGMLTIRTVDLTSASSWASSAVNAYYLRGLLPAEFCTGFQKAVTRAEMARYLYQLCAYELDLSKLEVSYVYRDIGDSDYADAILACTALGLFSGTGEKTFSPDAPVTREQAAKLLVRTMELLTGQKLDASANPGYTDAAKISGWASSCVSAATAAGLMRGDSRGRFSPASGITREQLTVVLERICRTLDAQQKAAA
jgi:hypothetical protein